MKFKQIRQVSYGATQIIKVIQTFSLLYTTFSWIKHKLVWLESLGHTSFPHWDHSFTSKTIGFNLMTTPFPSVPLHFQIGIICNSRPFWEKKEEDSVFYGIWESLRGTWQAPWGPEKEPSWLSHTAVLHLISGTYKPLPVCWPTLWFGQNIRSRTRKDTQMKTFKTSVDAYCCLFFLKAIQFWKVTFKTKLHTFMFRL